MFMQPSENVNIQYPGKSVHATVLSLFVYIIKAAHP